MDVRHQQNGGRLGKIKSRFEPGANNHDPETSFSASENGAGPRQPNRPQGRKTILGTRTGMHSHCFQWSWQSCIAAKAARVPTFRRQASHQLVASDTKQETPHFDASCRS